jgi:dipeptidyl aminopeptidase/acylaminoacyl peptidase
MRVTLAGASGLFAYRSGPAEGRQFTWFDRSGRELGKLGEIDTSDPSDPALSPDGREVAVSREVDENRDIWLLDTSSGVLRRLTADPGIDRSATWSPDGQRLVFTSNRKGVGELYQTSSSGGDEKMFVSTREAKQTGDFSPDGRFLLFRTQNLKTRYDIWAVPVNPGRSSLELSAAQEPFVVVRTNSDERDPQGFLMNTIKDQANTSPITVVQNWRQPD